MAATAQAKDPYAEFGGSVATASADPYAEFGGQASPPAGVPEGTISARPGGVKNWLEDATNDVRYGTGRTLVGRGLRDLGARGIDVGVPESTGELVGGAAVGPLRAAHGLLTIPSHPVRGINEVISGASQGAALPLAIAAPEVLPEILPRVSLGAFGAKAGQKIASAAGASPETAELAGNVAGAATAASPEILNRVGPPVVRTTGRVLASPIGRRIAGGGAGAAIGVGIGEAVGHPYWGGVIGEHIGERVGQHLGRIGQRMRDFGVEQPNPFRDVPEPSVAPKIPAPESTAPAPRPFGQPRPESEPVMYQLGERRVPSTNEIRANIRFPKPGSHADLAEDREFQQQNREDLEQHGRESEEEGKREFIARNSTGQTKGQLVRRPVANARGGHFVSETEPNPAEDLTELLKKSLEAVKRRKE